MDFKSGNMMQLEPIGAWQPNANSMIYDGSQAFSQDVQINQYRLMQQLRMEERCQAAGLEINKKAAEKLNHDFISLETYDKKLLMQEKERERRRSRYEQLDLADGLVQVTVCNLRNEMPSVVVSNLRYPVLKVLKRLPEGIDEVYQVVFSIGECRKAVYLDKTRAGGGNYLLKKFGAEGIIFKADAVSQRKGYAQMLLAYLLNQNPDVQWVADDEGWAMFPGEGWRHVEGGSLTWKKVKKFCN